MSDQQSNGAQQLLQAFVHAGVDVCFTNPGTSEMHFVAALDEQDGMRAVLGLFEGVVTGAADGYARMAGKPACTLLHLGPGLANGLANLHNARRARSPLVNVIGEHASYHRHLDAPLTSDIEGFARPVSAWIRVAESGSRVAADAIAAVEASLTPPGAIASLILPADTAWNPVSEPFDPAAYALSPPPPRAPDADAVQAAASALKSGEPCLLLLNGQATGAAGLDLAGRIARHCDARLLGDTFIARVARGAGRVDLPRLPYFAEQAEDALAGIRHLILADTKAPVSFFAYPGRASELTPADARVHQLCLPGDDTLAALEALAETVGAGKEPPRLPYEPPALPTGALTPESIAQSVAALLPEQAVVVNEAATSGFAIPPLTARSAPHDWLDLTGGAIGMGLPASVGAAVACPDRRVLSLQADGSAMYTIQALWTMARENLDVTVVLFNNRKYAILQVEFMRVGAHNPGPKAMSMLDLTRPDLSFVDIARGMGVEAVQADDAASFNDLLRSSFQRSGPFLIKAVI